MYKKKSFLFVILFYSLNIVVNSWVLAAAVAGGDFNKGIFRISCIQLQPYDATKEICEKPYDCKCVDVEGVPEEAKYIDRHGLGKTFSYVSPDSIPEEFGGENIPGTHAYFVQKVVDHKEANFTKETKDDERNTLFVRMQCKFSVQSGPAEKTEQTYNFYLGLFVSGREDYYPQSGTKVSQLLPSCPSNTPGTAKVLINSTLSAIQKETIKHFRKVLLETSNADEMDIESQNVTGVSSAILSHKKNFILEVKDEQRKRFIIQSGSKRLDDYGYFIARRLFPQPQTIPPQPRYLIYLNLFGRLPYDPMAEGEKMINPCLVLKGPDSKEVKDGLGNCFFDSEQSFLSVLENPDAPCEIDFTVQKGVNYKLLCVDLSFYSFRDMCRFCRGTFSHMLQKEYLQKRVLDFLTNRFDAGKFRADEGYVFNVMVFGHEKTDKK